MRPVLRNRLLRTPTSCGGFSRRHRRHNGGHDDSDGSDSLLRGDGRLYRGDSGCRGDFRRRGDGFHGDDRRVRHGDGRGSCEIG